MLSTRILTAAVALPLAVLAIIYLPALGLAMAVGALMLGGAWEWAALSGLGHTGRVAYTVLSAGVMALVLGLRQSDGPVSTDIVVLGLAALFWLCAIGLVIRFPAQWRTTLGRRPLALAIGLVVLAAPVVAVAYIDQADEGPLLVLMLCLMIWGADTGAYAAGRTLGRHKLVPRVSPGKTVEGAAGGLIVAMLVGVLGAFVLDLDGWRTLAMALLGAWIASISIVGDLTISMFKRSAGVKDSGRLFPGHGGVLDRLDSMLAAAPWFVIGLHLVLLAA
ncbi:phosphatidate cytidylyltransferase [Salinisphaera hydrothermalis]|uniref:Phosphatidate cytidylyltransferase n=1 Tax=Salinisphaera hydrothermalis (strain C41B8) TaxID=1304275 RepID=A0A084IK11_SALHC|nr:phosphatidate cytidylyltransferase [Salinisphaera hydrothermalis]KEZ77045.1 phosphatidate cytidylyltransferase [Salinisphaera hydrothermalis C41B8]